MLTRTIIAAFLLVVRTTQGQAATSVNPHGYTSESQNLPFTVTTYDTDDCTGNVIYMSSGQYEQGVCYALDNERAQAINWFTGIQMHLGARLERHCLCGDRVFMEGMPIPSWPGRYCDAGELEWACSDDVGDPNGESYGGRQHMIASCCDQSTENDHFEWTGCSVIGEDEINRQPENYCTTSLEATGHWSNCAWSTPGSNCINLNTDPPRSDKLELVYAPPPVPPGMNTPSPPPATSPNFPASSYINDITALRDAINAVVADGQYTDLYLSSQSTFELGGFPIVVGDGKKIRLIAGDSGMPVLDGGGLSRIFDVVPETASCTTDADCNHCDVASICGEGSDLGPCTATCSVDNKCYIYRETINAVADTETVCDGVSDGELGSATTDMSAGWLHPDPGTDGNWRQTVHAGYATNFDFYGAYCWSSLLTERCYRKQDDPDLKQTTLELHGLHLTNGQAESDGLHQTDGYKTFRGAGGCIRGYYTVVALAGSKLTNCHAIDSTTTTFDYGWETGATGGAIFMLAGQVWLVRGGLNNAKTEISDCTATDTNGASSGGAITLVPVVPHAQNMMARLYLDGVTIYNTKANRGGAIAIGFDWWFADDDTFTDVENVWNDVEIYNSHAAPVNDNFLSLPVLVAVPSSLEQNNAYSYVGGAVYAQGRPAYTFSVTNLYVHDCTALSGAGLYLHGISLSLHDSTFERLAVNREWGGISFPPSEVGFAGDGGGINWYSYDSHPAGFNVTNTHFLDCTANQTAGGMLFRGPTDSSVGAHFSDVSFTRCGTNNTANFYSVGGGLAIFCWLHSYIEMHRVRFIENWVDSVVDTSILGSNTAGGAGLWIHTASDDSDPNLHKLTVIIYDSSFERNYARVDGGVGVSRGAGILLWTGEMDVTIEGSTFSDNTCVGTGGVHAEGGGVHRTETGLLGRLILSKGTRFLRNQALTSQGATVPSSPGHQLKVTGGDAIYRLPAPAGHYVIGVDCAVQRQACEVDATFAPLDANCDATLTACSLLANLPGQDYATIPSGDYAGQQCRPSTDVFQVCNWKAHDDLIGSQFQTLTFEDDEFPPKCSPGMLGSADPSDQMSPGCKSLCPPGMYCPTAATVNALPCKLGHYCPEGTSVAIPCAPGTFGNRTDLASQTECGICPVGHYCVSGGSAPIECPAGTSNNMEAQRECTTCSQGMFTDKTASLTCERCGAGNYSSNVLSCLPCGLGEYCPLGSRTGIKCQVLFTTTLRTGSTDEESCVCRKGMYMHNNTQTYTSECVQCPEPGEKTACNEDGATLEELPIMEGYWRSLPTSTEIRWCYTPKACLGGTNHSSQCREGHEGAFCDSCVAEYTKDAMGLCQPCEEGGTWGSSMAIMAVVCIIACLACGCGTWFVAKKHKDKKFLQKDFTEGQFAKNTGKAAETGPAQTSTLAMGGGGIMMGSIAWPAMSLPALMGVFKAKFPDIEWPELPNMELWQLQLPGFKPPGLEVPYITLPDCELPEFRAKFPHLQWPNGPGMSLPFLFNFLKIAFPTLDWPEMPSLDLPNWAWPEMPELKLPPMPDLNLPHWDLGMSFLGLSFEGFSIKLRILISLFQVLCQLGVVYSIPWPPNLSIVLSWFNVVQFDFITFIPFGCVMDINFYSSVLFQTLLLPIVSIPMVIIGKCCGSNATGKFLYSKYQDVVFWMLFIMYPSISVKIFGIFGCTEVDGGPGEDPVAWLRADLSIPCSGGTYSLMYAYAVVMVLIYPLGTPALYYYLMRKNAIALDKLKSNQILRTKLVEEHRAHSRFDLAESAQAARKRKAPNAFQRQQSKAWRVEQSHFKQLPLAAQKELAALAQDDVRERRTLPSSIKKLTKGYEMRAWYFEIFECFRKLSLACLPVFFQPSGSPGQLVFGLLVCFIAFGAYVAIDPFDDVANDTLAKICQAQIFFSLLSSVLLSYDEGTREDSTNLDMLLVFLWLMPVFLALFLQSPLVMVFKKLAQKRGQEMSKEAEKAVDDTEKATQKL